MNRVEPRSQEQQNRYAAQAAQAAVAGLPVSSTGVVEYRSSGRLLVIGGAEALPLLQRPPAPLRARLLLMSTPPSALAQGVTLLGDRRPEISGHLGAFVIELRGPEEAVTERLEADLILDLSPQPMLSMTLKPPGYLAAGPEAAGIEAAVVELAGLTGQFEKPRYFDYDPAICAHQRSGKIACSRCIEVCPADAIGSLGEAIAVDPYRCQGGGVCATVCPSGAIRYSYPDPADTLERLRTLLRTYREHGGREPVLVVVAESDAARLPELPANQLLLVVEELASVGLEVWLSALAYGAGWVVLVDGGSVPEGVDKALAGQLATAGEILSALGYPEGALRLARVEAPLQAPEEPMPEIKAAGFSGAGGKRQVAFLAIDHLHEQAPHPRPMANLSAGSPFGAAYVDESACTLCMACVGACPANALLGGGDDPRLEFIEAHCLQCGLCTRTCPEDAIWITPRLLFDRAQRSRPRLLYREEPFCCIACGRPFATRSVIDRMLEGLEGHWMYQTERARNRLRMCDDCRTLDALQDPDAMETDRKTRG